MQYTGERSRVKFIFFAGEQERSTKTPHIACPWSLIFQQIKFKIKDEFNNTGQYNSQNKSMQLTAIIEKSDDGWYVGQIEEIPAAISQGKTNQELKANLIDALNLLMVTNSENTELNKITNENRSYKY